MGRYVARRLIQFIPTILGTLFLLHLLSTLTIQVVGDPVRALFGTNAPPQEVILQLQAQYGLDDPCLEQTGNPCLGMFFDRLGQYAQGDFGVDFRQQPVMDQFLQRLPITARMATIALIFETVVGITLGMLAGLRKDKFVDNFVRVSTSLLIAFPVFVLGSLALLIFGLKLGLYLRESSWAPEWLGQIFQVGYNPDYPWLSLTLPGMVLGAFSLAAIARLTRTSLIENLRSDYVRTATRQGPHHPSDDRGAHAAQLADPRRHLHRHRHRAPAGRRDRHRGHLQRARRRPAGRSRRSSATTPPSSSAS